MSLGGGGGGRGSEKGQKSVTYFLNGPYLFKKNKNQFKIVRIGVDING
jgi:hypothetical protein